MTIAVGRLRRSASARSFVPLRHEFTRGGVGRSASRSQRSWAARGGRNFIPDETLHAFSALHVAARGLEPGVNLGIERAVNCAAHRTLRASARLTIVGPEEKIAWAFARQANVRLRVSLPRHRRTPAPRRQSSRRRNSRHVPPLAGANPHPPYHDGAAGKRSLTQFKFRHRSGGVRGPGRKSSRPDCRCG